MFPLKWRWWLYQCSKNCYFESIWPHRGKRLIGDLQNFNARLVYKTLEHIGDVRLCTFADAARPTSRDYKPTGLVIGLRVWNTQNRRQLFYILDRSSHKQKRFYHLSYGADIIATEAAEYRWNYFKTTLKQLFSQRRHQAWVECRLESTLGNHQNASKRLWILVTLVCAVATGLLQIQRTHHNAADTRQW